MEYFFCDWVSEWSGEVKYPVRDPTLNNFQFKCFLKKELSITNQEPYHHWFYFNQAIMRGHGIEQLWECIKTSISNYESVLLPLATRWEKTMASGETKAEKGKRWEGRVGYLDKRLFSLTTMLKWTWVHGNAKKIKAKQKYSSQEKIKREI